MKRVLIISPHFPPVNAPDMQRVRQSFPFYKELGWEASVVAVKPAFIETGLDHFLSLSIPKDTRIFYVDALDSRWTRKLGLGSLALRSLWFYWRFVNRLLEKESFDLIFFSTTQFPLLILGAYWKNRYGIPYVIDMQDPWHTDYYQHKPKSERPPKYWFSYRLNKRLEPIAMKSADAIIAVSQDYCDTLQQRYNNITASTCNTITFGACRTDFEVLNQIPVQQSIFQPKENIINVVYTGIVFDGMKKSVSILLKALRRGLREQADLFRQFRFYFIGTTYANGQGYRSTLLPIAEELQVQDSIIEIPERIPYFEALKMLKDADVLLMVGSDNPSYTASKVFPYILAHKPLLAIFHEQSSVVSIIESCKAGKVVTYNQSEKTDEQVLQVMETLNEIARALPSEPNTDWEAFAKYDAKTKTCEQTSVFDRVLAKRKLPN